MASVELHLLFFRDFVVVLAVLILLGHGACRGLVLKLIFNCSISGQMDSKFIIGQIVTIATVPLSDLFVRV